MTDPLPETSQAEDRLSLYSVIEFADDGDAELTPLGHEMTRAECDALAALIPAVTYSGTRPVKECYLTAVPTVRMFRKAGSHV